VRNNIPQAVPMVSATLCAVDHERGHRAAALAVVGAAVLFGTTGTAQELGPDASTPLGVGAVRIAIGAVALWVITRTVPRLDRLRSRWSMVLIGAAGVAVYQPGFFTGTDRLGVALGTIVALGSGPVFAGLIEWSTGTRPSGRWVVSTGVAIIGGGLLVFAGDAGASFSIVGLAGSLVAGLGYASYAVATKRLILGGLGSTEASAWQFSLGALATAPLLAFEPLGWLRSGGGVVLALHLGVVCTGVAYLLYGWGLRTMATSTATTLTLAEPVTASFLALVVLGERLRWFGWVGAALVMAALALVGGRRRVLRGNL
jgi:DME family drug/metabolite transporter